MDKLVVSLGIGLMFIGIVFVGAAIATGGENFYFNGGAAIWTVGGIVVMLGETFLSTENWRSLGK